MSEEQKDSLLQLVYASAAAVDFGDDELDKLLEHARSTNKSLNVTGVLLFAECTFFQVLEGKPSEVQSLYDKIEVDSRHDNVLMLTKRKIKERNFGEWSMGFVRDRQLIGELPGFVDFFAADGRTFVDLVGDEKKVKQILEGFRRGRWRRHPAAGSSV